MITSDKQYQTSKEQLNMLQEAFNANIHLDIPESVRNASKAQLEDLIGEVKGDIEEYETLVSSNVEDIPINTVEDLLIAPIRYRLASHMSVDAFGRKVGVSARQIHRYEEKLYNNTSTSTLTKILSKLDIKIEGHIEP